MYVRTYVRASSTASKKEREMLLLLPDDFASFVRFGGESRNRVFLATASTGVTTVVKQFDVTSNAQLRTCFKEAQLLRRMRHPAIAEIESIWQFPQSGGTIFCVEMPHYEQGQLDTWVREQEPDAASLRAVLREVLHALAHLHAHGVVHRDVKPANILMHNNQPRCVCFALHLHHPPLSSLAVSLTSHFFLRQARGL